MWAYRLENYSYLVLAFGQREVLLSLLGFLFMLALTWGWRRASVQSLLSAWLWFWIWMLPLALFGSMTPGADIAATHLRSVHEYIQNWLPLQTLSPCEVPYLERFNTTLPFYPLLSWHKLVLGLWLLIAAKKSLSLLYQRKQLSALAKAAPAVDQPHLTELVDNWRQRFHLTRAVSLRSSEDCHQAFTVGVIHPVVYLPNLLLRELSLPDIEAVLGHELAHIKRYDDIFVCFQLVTRSILFFNPLIWLSARHITLLRERRCDLLAMHVGKLSPQNYAKSLLRVAELPFTGTQQNPLFDSEVAAGLTSSALAHRVGYLLKAHDKRFSYLPLLIAAAGLLSLNTIFMPDLSDLSAIRGKEAKALLTAIDAVPPMSPLSGKENFIASIGNPCTAPNRGHYHPGIDFVPAAHGDRTVHAIADGKVVAVNTPAPYTGAIVQIEHANDITSTYVHLRNTRVQPGDSIHVGQNIGTLDGDHLHLEIRQDLRVVDPSALLNN